MATSSPYASFNFIPEGERAKGDGTTNNAGLRQFGVTRVSADAKTAQNSTDWLATNAWTLALWGRGARRLHDAQQHPNSLRCASESATNVATRRRREFHPSWRRRFYASATAPTCFRRCFRLTFAAAPRRRNLVSTAVLPRRGGGIYTIHATKPLHYTFFAAAKRFKRLSSVTGYTPRHHLSLLGWAIWLRRGLPDSGSNKAIIACTCACARCGGHAGMAPLGRKMVRQRREVAASHHSWV